MLVFERLYILKGILFSFSWQDQGASFLRPMLLDSVKVHIVLGELPYESLEYILSLPRKGKSHVLGQECWLGAEWLTVMCSFTYRLASHMCEWNIFSFPGC